MSTIVIHPTSTAQWHSLICEAEAAANFYLDEELQSYVVFLLMRFLSQSEIAAKVLALDYINGMRSSGNQQFNQLRDVGDSCLLYAGFFPKRAARKRVSSDYYVNLGSGAYRQLSDNVTTGLTDVYARLSETFVSIKEILQAMQSLGDPRISDPLEAYSRWVESGSKKDLRSLEESIQVFPGDSQSKKHH